MGIQQVYVDDEETAETAVLSYLAKGYVVANKRPGRITLQKAKAFNVLWALLGFLFCVLPLLIYMIWFSMQPDVSIVEIIVGSPTRGISARA